MSYMKLKLPAGVRWHGTEYQCLNRWYRSNLIRWDGDALKPVGGWTPFYGVAPASRLNGGAGGYADGDQVSFAGYGTVRDIHSWFLKTAAGSDGASYQLAVGTPTNLLICDGLGTITDLTMVDFTPGSESAALNGGYGGGLYNAQAYGTPRQTEGQTKLPATTWSLDNYGDYLVAVSTTDRQLRCWFADNADMTADPLTDSPLCLGVVATEERFLFALGAADSSGGINTRRIAWCDRENPEDWTATASNEAGGFELQTDGAIRCGLRVRGRTLILTTNDAHVAQYYGPPLVYGFQRVGMNCGVYSDRAAAATGAGAFWMGNNGFYYYDGSAVSEVPCDVEDYVFGRINHSFRHNVYAIANAKHNEIWWFYTSNDAPITEVGAGDAKQFLAQNDAYVAYDYQQNIFHFGQLSRVAGVDSGVFSDPIWVDGEGLVWRHEVKGAAHGGELPYIESGPLEIGSGDQVMRTTQVLTDILPNESVNLEFTTRFQPQGGMYEYGPFAVTPKTDVRFTGRQVAMRVTAADTSSDFRVGDIRLAVSAGGRR